MKILLLTLALIAGGPDLNRIATINRLKQEARRAFENRDYEGAIGRYRTLTDSLGQREDPLLLNLAHACFMVSDTANASYYYQQAAASDDTGIRSVANNQLGLLEQQRNRPDIALEHFKQAMRSNPGNEEARYNYELLKKLMDEQQQEAEDNQDQKDQQDQQQQQQQQKQEEDQKKQDQQDGEQDKSQQQQQEQKEKPSSDPEQQDTDEEGKKMERPPESRREILQELNMTEERARMILEAMRNSEIQYIQQQRRQPTKRTESGKPDW